MTLMCSIMVDGQQTVLPEAVERLMVFPCLRGADCWHTVKNHQNCEKEEKSSDERHGVVRGVRSASVLGDRRRRVTRIQRDLPV